MTNDTHKNDIEYSKKTISELEKYNITPIPKCYEVMFEFIKGDNLEIQTAIHKFLEKEPTLTEPFLLRLHASILSYDTIARTVDTVTTMLTTQISGLNNSFATSDEELSLFTNAIDSFSQHLNNCDNGDDESSNNIITYIIDATTRIKNKIKELESDLNSSQLEIKKLHNYLDNMCQEAMIDPLTSLATRKRFDQILSKSIRNSLEVSEKMAIAFIEVDNYDCFKEKWGQITSEQILRFAASSIKENIKGRDSASRYSESLFIMLLPKTDTHGTRTLSEHIRNTIERKRIVKKATGEFLGRVTVSIGIAEFNEGESLGNLINRAERCLSIARNNGKNCTITEEDAKKLLHNSDNFLSSKASNG
jgi:diguanylate cyclase